MTIEFKTVAEAAEWLDGVKPGWAARIDLGNFQIANTRYCPFGYTFPELDYYEVMEKFNINSNWTLGDTTNLGKIEEAQKDWVKEINARRNGVTSATVADTLTEIEKKLIEDFRAGKVQYKPMVKKELVFQGYCSNPSNLSDGMDFNRFMSHVYNNAYVRECPLDPKDAPVEIKITYEVPAE